ncbi:hypothetical protein, partial [Plasmodium yoelii yoelii]
QLNYVSLLYKSKKGNFYGIKY